jgi:hypothetical protein
MIHVDPALSAPETRHAATAPARALIDGQMAMLSRLAQIGMELAEACGRDARAEAGDGPAPSPEHRREIGLVFARVARAVRMTIALQSRLAGDLAALDRADDVARMRRKTERRFRLSRLCGEAARASVDARRRSGAQRWSDEDAIEDEIERLSAEACERLTDAEDGDLWGRPFDEVVARICADLKLSPEWGARLRAAVEPPPSHSPPEPHPPPPVILGRSAARAQTRGPSSEDVDEGASRLGDAGPRLSAPLRPG